MKENVPMTSKEAFDSLLGMGVSLVVIVVGTVVGKPAPQANIDRAWGEKPEA